MSTRSIKGIWLLLVESLDFERVIRKSKRAVDTLQATIDSVEIQASIDTIHPASIDTIHPTSIRTVHLALTDTVHPGYCSSRHCSSGDDLEESGDFGVFWRLFSAELHRRVRCLAMDGDIPTVRLSSSFNISYIFELPFQCHRFEVNQHPIADIMHALLNSGQSASRVEAVEEMKDCRSTVHP
uniref:Uncharacterized protein n=1 Tax=Brassica campestris TaxID=3711 RepID=M4F780_BRACM